MMKKYMRSVERRIVRKRSKQGEGVSSEEAVAESGSRVLSLRTPPEERMMTFRRRSSTRIFVRKKAIADDKPGEVNCLTRVLQTGKRLYLSEPVKRTEDIKSDELADIRWFETNGKEESGLSESFPLESDGNELSTLELQGVEKMFVNVYSRKRPRNPAWGGRQANDSRFKHVFSRKQKNKKPKVTDDCGELRGYHFGETEGFFTAGLKDDTLQFREQKSNFLETVNINKRELRTSLNPYMMRATMNIRHFASFLLSEPIGNAFLQHGIHFLPVTVKNENSLLRSSVSKFGTFNIYGSCEFLPLVCVNFLALPSYFKSLHLTALLCSKYLHFSLSPYSVALNLKINPDSQGEDCGSHVGMETEFPGTNVCTSINASVNKKATIAVQTSAVVTRSAGILRGSRQRKLQRKRPFLKHSRTRKFSSINCHGTSHASQNGAILSSVDPLHVRQPETFVDDPLNLYSNNISTLPVSHSKLAEVAKKNHGGQMKEIKAALSDIKQNIDLVHCNATIMVTAGDRCWREEGAVVSLELSDSMEWCLAVKTGRDLRYLHKPQDIKYALNRFTHSYMWIAEDAWRLEFSNKLDWLAFKELHAECHQRNNPPEDASVKIIPIPVFMDVPAYEGDGVTSFLRPEQYIRMKHDDEILRASVNEVPYYDMDSGDEKWLQKHNASRCSTENDTYSYLSEDTFERMIFTFEKNAYYCSSNAICSEREPSNHEELGSKEMVADVYDYWLKKRKQKRGPLVRVFQGPSLRKPLMMQRHVLRKRRSLKKQRNQVGRGKPACLFNSKAKQETKAETLHKVQEAENAWRRSMEAAIPLRRRAQLLMENADLAAYKSVMSLRIAEAIRSSVDASSAFLDLLPDELLH